MKYIVLKDFRDSKFRNHVYLAGEEYPCEGYQPTEARFEELRGAKNKLGVPLIAESTEAAAAAEAEPVAEAEPAAEAVTGTSKKTTKKDKE